MNKLEENIFIQEICLRLDASIEHLDPLLSARLDSSRQDALQDILEMQANSLAQKVRHELDNESGVSAEIEARLDQIRQQAIAQLHTKRPRTAPSPLARFQDWIAAGFPRFSFSIPATALGTACVLVTVVSIFTVNSRPGGSFSLEDELGLVASAEDIELYENLDFYLWLAENDSLSL